MVKIAKGGKIPIWRRLFFQTDSSYISSVDLNQRMKYKYVDEIWFADRF